MHKSDAGFFNGGNLAEFHERHENEWELDGPGTEFFPCGESVYDRHDDVTDNDVRLKQDGSLEQRLAIAHLADDLKLRTEQFGHNAANLFVIFSDEHAQWCQFVNLV
jgi:hypothetical protein